MSQQVLEWLLANDPSKGYAKWFDDAFQNSTEKCSIEDFAVYFLNFIRNQTEEYTKGSISTCNTPRKTTELDMNSQSQRISSIRKRICDSFGDDNLNTSSVFSDDSLDFQSDGFKPLKFSSTPTRNNCMQSTPIRKINTTDDVSYSKSFASQNSYDRMPATSPLATSSERSSFRQKLNSSPLCLSDFMSVPTTKVKNRRNVKENQNKSENSSLLSENDFPAIGKRAPKSNQKTTASSSSVSLIEVPINNVTPIRPRKRVAPITVKTTTQNNFGSIAYRADNNLLDLNNDDTTISRDLLRNVGDIAKEFESESKLDKTLHIHGQKSKANTTNAVRIDLKKVTQVDVLNRMILIYAIIIDSNLTTNCLTEVSFLLNLLNAEYSDNYQPQCNDVMNDQMDELIEPHLINRHCCIVSSLVFKNIHNCVYFSAGVLSKQRHLLMLLDLTTIKVLMDNERLMEFGERMKEFLTNVHAHKTQLDSIKCSNHDVAFKQGGVTNVFYQQDDDTKEHFPSMREFSSFKNQRDGFYNVLRIWESNHFNPMWSFANELGPKIRNLLGIMRHPINMAHLAKLFTAQLILSCNFEDTSSDLQQALQIEPSKLSKLQQRLIAPSYFATDYMYPGSQAFFRDFLKVAESEIIFMEQLKIVLINELLELNGSSFETLNLSSGHKKSTRFDEYFVRPETVVSMRVLAKFLGLIYSKPFAYDGTRNLGVDSRQIDLRNVTHPIFDIKGILSKSIESNRLIVTIPWLVQFLSMLDYVTLRLNYFVDIFHMLYTVYMKTTDFNTSDNENRMRPTSLFIIKACLGWLFEQPHIPDEYHKFRQDLTTNKTEDEMSLVQVLVPKSVVEYFNKKQFMLTYHNVSLNTMNCTLSSVEQKQSRNHSINCSHFSEKRILATFDPMMENILNAACPFLRDFRVSIMPTKHSKTVSRSGKYRHITTQKTAETKIAVHDQTKLAEAFLQSQSLSVRRTIEFVIERTVSAVIKDFQMQILIPMKRAVNEEINCINETEKRKLANEMYERFTKTQAQLNKKWGEFMPRMTRERAQKAFDALLPNETSPIVKQTCTNLAVEKCRSKANEWKNMNLVGIDFFTKDLSGDAYKLIKNRNVLGKQPNILSFNFEKIKVLPSSLLGKLQVELHYASMKPERTSLPNIEAIVRDLVDLISNGALPSVICRTICFSTLNLMLLLVHSHPDLIEPSFLETFTMLWNCKLLEYWTKPPEESTNDENLNEPDPMPVICPTKSRHIFSNLINNCLMHKLMSASSKSFDALEKLLLVLIKGEFLTIPSLNEQFVSLLREEWPEELLQNMSSLISKVSSKAATTSDDKAEFLFMEMLSDLSKDIIF